MYKSFLFGVISILLLFTSTLVASKVECIKPTVYDDQIFLNDQIVAYPSVEASIKSMDIRRYYRDEFSLLVPSGLKVVKKLSNDILLQLSGSSNKQTLEYILREISFSKKLIDRYKPNVIVAITAKILVDEAKRNGFSNIVKPKIYAQPGLIISNFAFAHKQQKPRLVELHTLIFDGKHIYNIVLLSDKRDFKISKFLSSLAAYSFWTKELCRQ